MRNLLSEAAELDPKRLRDVEVTRRVSVAAVGTVTLLTLLCHFVPGIGERVPAPLWDMSVLTCLLLAGLLWALVSDWRPVRMEFGRDMSRAVSRSGVIYVAIGTLALTMGAIQMLGITELSIPTVIGGEIWLPSPGVLVWVMALGFGAGLEALVARNVPMATVGVILQASVSVGFLAALLSDSIGLLDTTDDGLSQVAALALVLIGAASISSSFGRGHSQVVFAHRGASARLFINSAQALTLLVIFVSLLLILMDGQHTRTSQSLFIAGLAGSFAVCLALIEVAGHRAHRREHLLMRQAYEDELTGLLNRDGFWTIADWQMQALLASSSRNFALIETFDLDHLKAVNDRLGHDQGDHLIAQFGQSIREALGPSAIAGRIGGDEFVVLSAAADATTANQPAEPIIRRALGEHASLEAPPWRVEFTSGSATFDPTVTSLQSAFREADRQMITRKAARGRQSR